jgi:lipopolysaccharide transport system permease protein
MKPDMAESSASSLAGRRFRALLRAVPGGLLGPIHALVAHRSLLWVLVRREVVARTSGTLLGGFWVLAQPALQVAALWFLLDVVLRVRFPGQAPFLNYFLIGMLAWLTISEILNRNLTILAECGPLYQRAIFPLEILPMLPLVVTGITYGAIYACVAAVLEGPSAGVAAVVVVAVLMLWLIPLCYLFSVIGLFLKDARQLIPFVLTLLMYATPILYLPEALPKSFQILLPLNPLADIMALIHALVQGMPWRRGELLRPLVLWVALLGPSWILFRRAAPHMREAL